MASSTMAIHPRLGYLDIGTKGYNPHELLAGFSLQWQHRADVITAGDISPSAFAFDFFSNLTICCAPVVTARNVRIYHDTGLIRVSWDYDSL
jgi:hypothetical protein